MEIKSYESANGPAIWALSDGRAGNAAMAEGLAARVAGMTGGRVERRDVTMGPLALAIPPFLWSALPSGLALAQAKPALGPPFPDLVVGAGRRVAPIATALRTRGVKAVQILDPKMPARRFDLVVAPEHDGLNAPNMIATLGSVNRITPDLLATEGERWRPAFAALPRPLVAVLIGGATKRTPLTAEAVARFAEDLRQLSKSGLGLTVTASRRTGDAHAQALRAALPDAWFWDGTGDNPYVGMLACADAIVVTDDSVNMASEAAATGKPVAIYPLLREGGKIARFHDALIAHGHAEWFGGAAPTASAGPLDETGRAAQAVAALL